MLIPIHAQHATYPLRRTTATFVICTTTTRLQKECTTVRRVGFAVWGAEKIFNIAIRAICVYQWPPPTTRVDLPWQAIVPCAWKICGVQEKHVSWCGVNITFILIVSPSYPKQPLNAPCVRNHLWKKKDWLEWTHRLMQRLRWHQCQRNTQMWRSRCCATIATKKAWWSFTFLAINVLVKRTTVLFVVRTIREEFNGAHLFEFSQLSRSDGQFIKYKISESELPVL